MAFSYLCVQPLLGRYQPLGPPMPQASPFGPEENLETAKQTEIEWVVVDENGSKQPRLSPRLEG